MTPADLRRVLAVTLAPDTFREAMTVYSVYVHRQPGRWLKLDRVAARDIQAAYDRADDVLATLRFLELLP
jgi:hypothetical protein